MKKYKVTFRDGSSVIVPNKQSIEDERLSPMTYKKLKEMGYTPEKWKILLRNKQTELFSKGVQNKLVLKPRNKSMATLI